MVAADAIFSCTVVFFYPARLRIRDRGRFSFLKEIAPNLKVIISDNCKGLWESCIEMCPCHFNCLPQPPSCEEERGGEDAAADDAKATAAECDHRFQSMSGAKATS